MSEVVTTLGLRIFGEETCETRRHQESRTGKALSSFGNLWATVLNTCRL